MEYVNTEDETIAVVHIQISQTEFVCGVESPISNLNVCWRSAPAFPWLQFIQWSDHPNNPNAPFICVKRDSLGTSAKWDDDSCLVSRMPFDLTARQGTQGR